ncbi:DUF393 domain-containing protein [Pseudomonas trivialis]|uniref:thiol-disulfide oxidoreductase DCC family protein n=1 Tax=Pseudomonas trivialis TaxID=200450 RepID=UPI0030D41A63
MYKKTQWPLTLYFDGDCPLCAREIKLLSARATPDRLLFVDISAEAFDATRLGLTAADMASSLHARFADGTWVTGLDATLWSWRAAGLGAWAAPLSWRLTRPLLNIGYRLFCRWRPHLAWLPHPDGSARCSADGCTVPGSRVTRAEKRPRRPTGHQGTR